MATIKSYTNLEQSQKLAGILPLETADMCFSNDGTAIKIDANPYNVRKHMWKDVQLIPCWSLAALLNVLPFHLIVDNQRYAFSMIKGLDKNGETYAIKYAVFNTTFYLHLTDFYNNPVDAAFEMVCWLLENKRI